MAFTPVARHRLSRPAEPAQAVRHPDMLPANERWSVLRWVPGPPAELVLQGPGLAGTDQINVGILSEAGADYGNWKLRGFVGWNPAQTFDGQYNPSGTFYALLMASGHALLDRGQRSPHRDGGQDRHLLRNDASGPVPALCDAGPVPVSAAGRRHVQQFDALEQFLHLPQTPARRQGYSGAYYAPTGVWTGVSAMWPNSWGSNTRECPDGSYPLLPSSWPVWGDGRLLLRSGLRQCRREHHQRRRRRSSGGAGRVPHRLQRLLGLEARVR